MLLIYNIRRPTHRNRKDSNITSYTGNRSTNVEVLVRPDLQQIEQKIQYKVNTMKYKYSYKYSCESSYLH
ncbi:uncharacterized protein M6B38_284900 [Iris pallida]|uniref:Uncharacterized protein n=1 Tax=Iris pallida TaxID=29817 RepID=A0AAX6EH93_IRIPA|nr:uncharacterized protein M6B38_108270 [Iris pallida]KAJ6847113.1 uncharacterized protein M6B38_284900 [Iris pallida]